MSTYVTVAVWASSIIAALLAYWYGAIRTYYWLASSSWAGFQKHDGTVRLAHENWAWAIIFWPAFVPLKRLIVGLFAAARRHALKPTKAQARSRGNCDE